MSHTATQFPLPLSMDQEASFDSFLTLTNQASTNYLQQLVQNQAECWCFISGAAGTGKSHLLQAVINQANRLGQTAIYLDCEELLAVMGESLDRDQPAYLEDAANEMLASVEQYDVIALDNLHAFEGDAAWQRSVFYLLVKLKQKQCSKIVFAASKNVVQLGFSLADLVSRLSSATTFQLKNYSDDDKQSILIHRAKRKGLDMNDDVASYVLQRYSRDLNKLINALNRLDTQALARQRGLTIPFVRQELQL